MHFVAITEDWRQEASLTSTVMLVLEESCCAVSGGLALTLLLPCPQILVTDFQIVMWSKPAFEQHPIMYKRSLHSKFPCMQPDVVILSIGKSQGKWIYVQINFSKIGLLRQNVSVKPDLRSLPCISASQTANFYKATAELLPSFVEAFKAPVSFSLATFNKS